MMNAEMCVWKQEQPRLKWMWTDPRQMVILTALREAGGQMKTTELARLLGAHPETVTEKLHSLAAMGMVGRPGIGSGWCLTAAGLLFIQGDGGSWGEGVDGRSKKGRGDKDEGVWGQDAENPRF